LILRLWRKCGRQPMPHKCTQRAKFGSSLLLLPRSSLASNAQPQNSNANKARIEEAEPNAITEHFGQQ